MKLASTLVAVATALTFTSALAASNLTSSSGAPVSSSAGTTIAVEAPVGHVEPAPAPVVEQKAPMKKTKKKAKKKTATKPAATTTAPASH